MYPVSEAYLRTLTTPHRLAVDVAYSNDRGMTWIPMQVVSGSVTADRTSQVRWACTLTLTPDTPTGLDGISPYGTRLRVRRGVQPLRGSPEWVPLGIHRVNTVTTATDGTVSVDGASMEQQVSDTRLLTPQTLGGGSGDSAVTMVEQLIREAVPDASFEWRVNGDGTVAQVHQDTDRWGLIDGDADSVSIARSLGAEVYCNGSGTWVIAPTPTLYDDPVWSVGRGLALVDEQTDLSRDGVYNVVVATGESTDTSSVPVGPGLAWDNDPMSPTYAGPDPVHHPELAGPFGVIARFYSSSLLTSLSGCQVAAQSLIADALGLAKTVGFETLINPALEPGDVVLVERDDGSYENHLIDSFTIDLTAASMACATRATTTRLLGLGDVLVSDTPGDIAVSTEGATA